MIDLQRKLVLLGPQPEFETLPGALRDLKVRSKVASITAGWETEEHDDGALRSALNVESINLDLFGRSERLFSDDPELIEKLRARQDELRHLRDVYNDRLHHLLKAARQMIRKTGTLVDVAPERESSIEMVRQLDREYFVRTSQINDRYDSELELERRPEVVRHRREIESMIHDSDALLISGGHVAIILNRLKIFGILEMQPKLPVVAWSGGAMALSDQVVFFHDSPPQGAGDAEVLRAGMGLFHDVLPLPDADSRLNLDDQARVELFARRFDLFQCVIFDRHTYLERSDGVWASRANRPPRRLGEHGQVEEWNQ